MKCERCKKEFETKYSLNLKLTYGGRGGFRYDWCTKCVCEIFNIPETELAFYFALVEFKFKNKISESHKFDDEEIKQFFRFLEKIKNDSILGVQNEKN